jgi:hypothetical protein
MPFLQEGNNRLEGFEDNPGPQRPAQATIRHMFAEWMTGIRQNIWTTNGARTNFAYGRGPQTYRNVMNPNSNRTVSGGTVESPAPLTSSSLSARNQIANGS